MSTLNDLKTNLERIQASKSDIKDAINTNLNTIKGTSGVDYCGNKFDTYAGHITGMPVKPETIQIDGDYFVNSIYDYNFTNDTFSTTIANATGQQHTGIQATNVSDGIVGTSNATMLTTDETRYIDTPMIIFISSQDKKSGSVAATKQRIIGSPDLEIAVPTNTSGGIGTVNYRNKVIIVKDIREIPINIDTITNVGFNFSYLRNEANVGGQYYTSTSSTTKRTTLGTGWNSVIGTFGFGTNPTNPNAVGNFQYSAVHHNRYTNYDNNSVFNDFTISSDGTYAGSLMYGNALLPYNSYREYNERSNFPLRLSQLYKRASVDNAGDAVPVVSLSLYDESTAAKIVSATRDIVCAGDVINYTPRKGFYFKKETVVLYKEGSNGSEYSQNAIVMYARQYKLGDVITKKCIKVNGYSTSNDTNKKSLVTVPMPFYESEFGSGTGVYGSGGSPSTGSAVVMSELVPYLFGMTAAEKSQYSEGRNADFVLNTGGTPITCDCGRFDGSSWKIYKGLKLQSVTLTSNAVNSSETIRTLIMRITFDTDLSAMIPVGTDMITTGTFGLRVWRPNVSSSGRDIFGTNDFLKTSSNWIDDWYSLKGSITLY